MYFAVDKEINKKMYNKFRIFILKHQVESLKKIKYYMLMVFIIWRIIYIYLFIF